MTSPSRSTQFVKVHKVLKKYYKPVVPLADRPVLEHLLFACCLENAPYEKAEEAFAALVHTFFDWNEIRVTTVKELAEVMGALPDPTASATRIKRVLQHVFEASYCFDLEELRKKNLGPTVERLEKTNGVSRFAVSYVVQSALGGHAIPIDAGALAVMRVLELVSDKDMEEGVVPGLERAIAKNKGIEFGSLLHQLGADYMANPYVPSLHKILVQIDPDVESRLPKRRAKDSKGQAETAAPAPAKQKLPETPESGGAEPPQAESTPAVPDEKGKGPRKKKAAVSEEATPAAGPVTDAAPPAAESKPAAPEKKGPPSKKNVETESEIPAGSPKLAQRSAAAGITKRKPR